MLIQRVTKSPIATHTGRHLNMYSVAVGDAAMSGYNVSVEALADWTGQTGEDTPIPVLLIGSHAGGANVNPSAIFDTFSAGFVLVVYPTAPRDPRGNATWKLMSKGQTVASGGGKDWAVGDWIRMSIDAKPSQDETAETGNGGTWRE